MFSAEGLVITNCGKMEFDSVKRLKIETLNNLNCCELLFLISTASDVLCDSGFQRELSLISVPYFFSTLTCRVLNPF